MIPCPLFTLNQYTALPYLLTLAQYAALCPLLTLTQYAALPSPYLDAVCCPALSPAAVCAGGEPALHLGHHVESYMIFIFNFALTGQASVLMR